MDADRDATLHPRLVRTGAVALVAIALAGARELAFNRNRIRFGVPTAPIGNPKQPDAGWDRAEHTGTNHSERDRSNESNGA